MKSWHAILLAVCLLTAHAAEAAPWQVYQGCKLRADLYFDGDSFQLKAPTGYTYVFRLYGADCPEMDSRIPSRNAEQMAYFGVNEATLLRFGREARDFTARYLARGAEVHTRKRKSFSGSDKNRYYAFVIANNIDLAEALVANGLARAFGVMDDWEVQRKTIPADRLRRKLEALERTARSRRVGIWAHSSRR